MTERRNLLQESLSAIERLQARLDASERAKHEPIAIIGAGCRYPGGVETPDDLWRVVRDGVDAVGEVPADRWDASAYYDPDPQAPGKMSTRRGGFLSQVDGFDAQFFGISPREASTLDPQQRLLLETATEALESAGLATDRLAGSATGVFVGITTSDYGQLLRLGGPEHSDVYSATGSAFNAAAGRVSFTYGFQGPSMAVDSACSSSLVVVHLACQSLRSGESDLALAGGVNVILSPYAMVLFSKWGMMAPDGACKSFDAAADGFVRAEGCAMIALKRLTDAQAAGDPILAVIRGSAVNSNGRSSGLTVPNGPAQQAVLLRALADAGLNPADIDYVEAQGTGTPLGDPIEIEALGTVMQTGRNPDRPLKIGSVKTNLGHTEAASGLAGLLKVVMALRHEAIPPHLHFSTPNPGIPWSELPLTVPTSLTPWPRSDRPRRAGVSAFGFSGTNAHVILEEAPAPPAERPASDEPCVIVLSARSEPALQALARRHATYLADGHETSLRNFATMLATGRTHYERRLAFVADSISHAIATLRRAGDGEWPDGVVGGALRIGERPKIAFLFTDARAESVRVDRALYDSEPVFRAAIDACAQILRPRLDRPLLELLFPACATDSAIAETAYTRPALFAVEYALAEVWRSWGVTPTVVAGQGVGEYVAACLAGVFGLEDALALVVADTTPDSVEPRAAEVACAVPRIPLVSNATGQLFAPGTGPDMSYWRRPSREAVPFSTCIDSLRTTGVYVLFEVGPYPATADSTDCAAADPNGIAPAPLRCGGSDPHAMLAALGAIYARGAAVKWDAVMGGRGARRALLPTYPFQRERHWVSTGTPDRQLPLSGHPLVGPHLVIASAPGVHVWEREVSLETHPWIADHMAQGAAILPAAAFVEMALQAGKESLTDGALCVAEIEMLKPMILHDHRPRIVQATLTESTDGARFAAHSRPAGSLDGAGAAPQWTAHFTARLTAIAKATAGDREAGIDAARARCARELGGSDFYAALAKNGNEWGPCFQGMDHVWCGRGEAVGRVRVLSTLIDVNQYRFHPAVSDACGHSLIAAVSVDHADEANRGMFVGGGVGEVRFYQSPVGTTLWTHATLRPQVDGASDTMIGDVAVYDESRTLISETLGARLRCLDQTAGGDILSRSNDRYGEVEKPEGKNVAARGNSRSRLSVAGLREATNDAQRELIGTYLRTEAARVLGLAAERLDPATPLSSFGFDSLMAVQLKNQIQTDLFAVLPMTEFLRGPSVDDLSVTLLQAVDLNHSMVELAGGDVETWEEGSL